MGALDRETNKPVIDMFAVGKIDHEKIQNKRLDKTIGGQITKASGATQRYKGDRSLGSNLLVEQKATKAQSMIFTYKWLEKINKEAIEEGKEPALAFSFLSARGYTPKHWVAVPDDFFARMYSFCIEYGFDF